MNRTCIGILCLFALFLLQLDAHAEENSPQARPIRTWLRSVKDGDEKKLETVFSAELRKQIAAGGWDKALKTYQIVFKQEFGNYELEDFEFAFTGDERKGKVSIVYKKKKLPGLRVIKEGTVWKVNER